VRATVTRETATSQAMVIALLMVTVLLTSPAMVTIATSLRDTRLLLMESLTATSLTTIPASPIKSFHSRELLNQNISHSQFGFHECLKHAKICSVKINKSIIGV